MSLLELLTGSVVFIMAAGSSLQLLGLAAAATLAQARQEQRMEEGEASLLRAEAVLRRPVSPASAASGRPCAAVADQWMRDLAAMPLAPGLARRLERAAGGEGVLLSLAVRGQGEPRQRLYLPRALGVCGASATAPAARQTPVAPVAVDPVPPQGGVDGAS